MKTYVVAEGRADLELLKRLVGDDEKATLQYQAAGGWSSADSLARSLLTMPDSKVALVVDADSSDPDLAAQREQFLRQSLGQIADSTRWRVFVIVPEIERLLFQSRELLEQVIGQSVSETDFIEGRFTPKAVLKRLSARPAIDLFRAMPVSSIKALQESNDIREIRKFLRSPRRRVAA